MNLSRFQGKRTLVFGGASGLGAATAERLMAEGAKVAIADRQFRPEDTPIGPLQFTCDIRDAASVEQTVTAARTALGDLDVVVNSVGVHRDGTAMSTTEPEWDGLIDVNLSGAFRIGRAVLPRMCERRSGVVVHIASDAGIVAWPGQVSYSAAKAGVVHLTKAQAVDVAPFGVRVNCICPSFADTPMIRRWAAEQDDPEAALADAALLQPMGRLAKPSEIAGAIAYLASDEADFVTGVALRVDGGICAQ